MRSFALITLLSALLEPAVAQTIPAVAECRGCRDLETTCKDAAAIDTGKEGEEAMCILTPVGNEIRSEAAIRIIEPKPLTQITPGFLTVEFQTKKILLGHFDDPKDNAYLLRPQETNSGQVLQGYVKITSQFLGKSPTNAVTAFKFPDPNDIEHVFLTKKRASTVVGTNHVNDIMRGGLRTSKIGWHRICVEALTQSGRVPHMIPAFFKPIDCIRIEVTDRIKGRNFKIFSQITPEMIHPNILEIVEFKPLWTA